MRVKRALAMLLCTVLTLTLCLTLLPRRALAVRNVWIGGQAVTSTSLYFKDGRTYTATDRPSDWTAWFTGDALQLRNLGQTGIDDRGIDVPPDPGPFSIVLVGNANSFALTDLSDSSAIDGGTLVFTGNGALSVKTGTGADNRYGIKADSITLQGGASLTAAGLLGATSSCVTTADWSKYTITAGSEQSGGNAVPVAPDVYVTHWDTYRYVRFTAIPQPGPAPDPGDGGGGVPKTGDETPLALLCGLVALSSAGLLVTSRKRRQTKRR